MGKIWLLIPFAIVSFIQNMAFTWSSRSRNSGDPTYHRWASWASNGVYYVTNALLTVYIVRYQIWWMLAIQGVVYTVSTAEGSVLMMRLLLKKEAGKRAVGGGTKYAQIKQEDWAMVQLLAHNSVQHPGHAHGRNRGINEYQYPDGAPVPMPGQGAKL